ncbi:MAG: putative Ig domain-containing protein, partial [Clostridium sp.]|nr:putative Ig domain-containing protein [Clostridium sp.]
RAQIYYKLGVNSEVFETPHYAFYKIFKGNYSNVSETANAEDITAQICSDTGYNFASGYQWLTMVTYDATGNVTGCLPFELRAYIETPSRYTGIDTAFYTKETNGTMSRAGYGSSYNSESGYTEYELNHGKSVNDIYYCQMDYEENGTTNNGLVTAAYVGNFNSVEEAQAAGATDVKSALFGTEGYPTNYSQGVEFSIFVGKRKYIKSVKVIESLYSGRDVDFIGLKDENGNELPFYIAERAYKIYSGISEIWELDKYQDSYGEYNFITMLVDSSVDLSQKLAPVFKLSKGAKLYTAGSSTEEVSGVSAHLFNNGPVQYTCSAEDGKNARNYWLQILKAEMGGKLYINSLEDEMSKTREENGVIYSTREVMLDGYHDYIHDILLINKGMDSIPALSAELVSDVVEMDEYWTLKGTHELKGFRDITTQGKDELSNQAKIRIKAKEGVDATEVSGTLTIKSNGNTLMVLNLTGTLGDPTIITKDIPEAVKYVPYGTMIQNNNKYSWNKVSYRLSEGKLPKGMVIKPNGEIYGVPQETGTFTFTVLMDNSGEFEDCTKEFTLTV